LDTVEILTKDGWAMVQPSLPVTSRYSCMALLNSTTVVLIGGKLGDKYYSPDTYMLNTAAESEEWIQGPALNFGRDYHSCAIIRCQFYQHFTDAFFVPVFCIVSLYLQLDFVIF